MKYYQTLGSFRELRNSMNEDYQATEIKTAGVKIKTEEDTIETPIVTSSTAPIVLDKPNKKKDNKPEILESAKQFARNISSIVETTHKDLLNQRENQLKYEVEWHKKYTLAISCILLFFVGAPMGAIIRRGGFGWPMVVSVVLFIFYFSINLIGEKLARGEVMPAYISVWLSTAA